MIFSEAANLTGSWSWPEHHFQASDLQGAVFLHQSCPWHGESDGLDEACNYFKGGICVLQEFIERLRNEEEKKRRHRF